MLLHKYLGQMVCKVFGLNVTDVETQEKAITTVATYNKQCEKLFFLQD